MQEVAATRARCERERRFGNAGDRGKRQEVVVRLCVPTWFNTPFVQWRRRMLTLNTRSRVHGVAHWAHAGRPLDSNGLLTPRKRDSFPEEKLGKNMNNVQGPNSPAHPRLLR